MDVSFFVLYIRALSEGYKIISSLMLFLVSMYIYFRGFYSCSCDGVEGIFCLSKRLRFFFDVRWGFDKSSWNLGI